MGFCNDLDSGHTLSFGVLNHLAVMPAKLKLDTFFSRVSGNLRAGYAGHPFAFLLNHNFFRRF
jgi:hypothetical protein